MSLADLPSERRTIVSKRIVAKTSSLAAFVAGVDLGTGIHGRREVADGVGSGGWGWIPQWSPPVKTDCPRGGAATGRALSSCHGLMTESVLAAAAFAYREGAEEEQRS